MHIDSAAASLEKLRHEISSLDWYHTIDLGNGIRTPGDYDHSLYLHHYRLPEDLVGKTAIDVGAANGFFSFELERRGARVIAIDLPTWLSHDFGPKYEPDKTREEGWRYMNDPFLLARHALGSRVIKINASVYDLTPAQFGTFDLVFCGSVLLHLMDPIRALWRIKSLTRGLAVIATAISPDTDAVPRAEFVGHHRGDAWWFPNRVCLERMVEAAGFNRGEWISTFRLDYSDGRPGSLHGVIHAWAD